MARRKKPEEHGNHEAWAIPYADLVTLLLAFFVVMYAISSVNAGKYRVVSDSLAAAFRGTPQSADPIALGEALMGPATDPQMSMMQQARYLGQPRSVLAPVPVPSDAAPLDAAAAERAAQLGAVARQVEQTLASLVMQDQVMVRNHGDWVEVEIPTDMLFGSGSATLSPRAGRVIAQLADVLSATPNPVRVEGHTDDVPIRNVAFPSNWELSAARAASVVRLLAAGGVDPSRLAVLGLGEFRPAASNTTAEGRNANRRVLLVILSSDQRAEGGYADQRGEAAVAPGESPGTQESAVDGQGAAPAAPTARPALPVAPEAAPLPAAANLPVARRRPAGTSLQRVPKSRRDAGAGAAIS
jgi:chemotaxis protein MotB